MALVKCPDCGTEISTEATACPKCGRPHAAAPAAPARRKTSMFTWVILGLIVFGVLSTVVSRCQQDREAQTQAAAEQARRAALTPQQRADEDAKLAEEAKQRAAATAKETEAKSRHDKNVQKAAVFANVLRKSMRNPDSFKLSEVLIMGDGSVCYTYRAQNGFGGMNVDQAVLGPSSFKTSDQAGFVTAWNKYCGGHTGEDATDYVNYLLEHVLNIAQ